MALLETLNNWQAAIAPYVNTIVIFFLILFIGFLIGKIASRLLLKFLKDLNADNAFKKATNISFPLTKAVAYTTAGIIYAITIILALNSLGVTTFLLEGVLLVLIIAILISALIAIKDTIPNAMAGITLRQQIKLDKKISFDDIQGKIKELKLFETIIETKSGDIIVIPNALFAKKTITIKK